MAPDAVLFLGLAALNAALAILVLGIRPRRRLPALAALLFGLNAVVAAHFAAWDATPHAPVWASSYLFNTMTLLPLAAIPLLFPRRRVSPRGERALFGGLAVLLLAEWAIYLPWAWPAPWVSGVEHLYYSVYYGAPALGTLLLLDAYLGAGTRLQRAQVGFLLAAYVAKVGVTMGGLPNAGVLVPPDLAVQLLRVPDLLPAGYAFGAILRVALAAVPLALAVSWLRRRQAREGGPWTDAVVLAALGLGLALPLVPRGPELEYLFLRPILLAYAILNHRLLDVELRERWGAVAAALLAGMATVFMVAVRALEASGADLGASLGVAFVASAATGGTLALPLARQMVGPLGDLPGPRGRDLYLAALEEALLDRDHDSSNDRVLRALRQRLRISDREHALLEATVRALHGHGPQGLAVGAVFLGRYEVQDLLGEGGFGRTFLAWDRQMGRRVVLKAARAASPGEARRVLREARLLARLDHPSIVAVHDVEQVGEDCILVLEHLEGGSLADRLARGPLSLAEALDLAEDLLAALEAAHAEGIVHRDLKPANVLFTRRGRAKLADFGVARAPAGSGTVSGFSVDGTQPGSLRYMSPEQVRDRTLDGRSDLYALGAVLYESLAGRPYLDFRGRAGFDVRLAVLEEAPLLPLPGAPREVSALLAGLLQKEPSRRPASAAEARRALVALRSGASAGTAEASAPLRRARRPRGSA